MHARVKERVLIRFVASEFDLAADCNKSGTPPINQPE
jgi:hypothetical protein